jgi:hypothetical protein
MFRKRERRAKEREGGRKRRAKEREGEGKRRESTRGGGGGGEVSEKKHESAAQQQSPNSSPHHSLSDRSPQILQKLSFSLLLGSKRMIRLRCSSHRRRKFAE